jgi:hypothetical protein
MVITVADDEDTITVQMRFVLRLSIRQMVVKCTIADDDSLLVSILGIFGCGSGKRVITGFPDPQTR